MANNEDDEVTKVLNLNDLKDANDELNNHELKLELYLLNYQTDYFQKHYKQFEKHFTVSLIDTLDELSKLVQKHPTINLAIYYNSNPKVANALLKQLNEHYPKLQSVIIAENLSTEKVKLHQSQPFAAKHYHDIKSDLNELAQKLELVS